MPTSARFAHSCSSVSTSSGARQVVEDDQLGAVHQRPRRGQPLALPARQAQAARADQGVGAVGHLVDVVATAASSRARRELRRRRSGRARRCRRTESEISCGTWGRNAAFGGTRNAPRSASSAPFQRTSPVTVGLTGQPEHRAQQRRLARADGAGDHGEAAASDAELTSCTPAPRRVARRQVDDVEALERDPLRARRGSGAAPLARSRSAASRRVTVLLTSLSATSWRMRSKATRACLRRASMRPTMRGRKLSHPR